MAKENKDKTVLNHIDQLVKEEERLRRVPHLRY
jgi:hypothetical protein